MIQFKEHKCLQGAEIFRYECTDTEFSAPQREREKAGVRRHTDCSLFVWELT